MVISIIPLTPSTPISLNYNLTLQYFKMHYDWGSPPSCEDSSYWIW